MKNRLVMTMSMKNMKGQNNKVQPMAKEENNKETLKRDLAVKLALRNIKVDELTKG